ncbi:MAG: hypothetical protein H6724_18785 [Sandaracinus sp.]|nr:hypothetical protein [Myxococcales bacterium]MCB9621489.1 hypothetical protein [Sandaracinus sp.]
MSERARVVRGRAGGGRPPLDGLPTGFVDVGVPTVRVHASVVMRDEVSAGEHLEPHEPKQRAERSSEPNVWTRE